MKFRRSTRPGSAPGSDPSSRSVNSAASFDLGRSNKEPCASENFSGLRASGRASRGSSCSCADSIEAVNSMATKYVSNLLHGKLLR